MYKINDAKVEVINKYSSSLIIFGLLDFALITTKKRFAKKYKRTIVEVS